MIVIPMAGVSRRFSEAGYTGPKYMLDLHGRTLFSHAVGSFKSVFDREAFLFIARDDGQTGDFITREVENLGIGRHHTVLLDRTTRGQAETVQLGLEAAAVAEGAPLTIFNIDTFRLRVDLEGPSSKGPNDGWLEVMRADDPGFSYARTADGGDRVVETAEKRVISKLASTGLYHFATKRGFDQALVAETAKPSAAELYVAPLYNSLIAAGGDVRVREVGAEDVIFCGVPAQYEALLRRPDLFAATA